MTSNLMPLSLTVKPQLSLLMEATKAGIITSPCCGIVPDLIAESAPKTPAAAMGMGKSAEEIGLFVGPMIGGTVVSIPGFTTAMQLYATITIIGSLIFLVIVPEPGLFRAERELCSK